MATQPLLAVESIILPSQAQVQAPISAPAKKPVKETQTPGRRLLFAVELRRGETTIVSWKKLLRDSESGNGEPSVLITNSLVPDSRPVTGANPEEDDLKHTLQPPNCFSAVIEKIERLYMGKESSDEEELDAPDDDQYDTEDSFIDDTELDAYFQVDKLATKHNGYFVNRGKLEWIEPSSSPNLAPKKRRRKDSTKSQSETDHEHARNEYATLGNNMKIKAAARNATLMSKKILPAEVMPSFDVHVQEGKMKAKTNAFSGVHKKLTADFPVNSDNPSFARILSKDLSSRTLKPKDFDKKKNHSYKDPYKVSGSTESFCPTNLAFSERSPSQAEPHLNKVLSGNNEIGVSTKIHRKDKYSPGGYPHRSSMTPYPTLAQHSLPNRAKETTIRPKGTIIERAIRDLEKIVVLARPPESGIPEADPSSQIVKRRLPQEIKQKLAKVARLSASQSKISEEDIINRLMGFLGHLVQRKTLKRNMREMVELGLSAKQQKADKFLQIKKEVLEMIKARVSLLFSKELEKQDGLTDDFQDVGRADERRLLKGKYCMDVALEDKICDLYDLHVEGMDEDIGPQSRKLYVKLSELWPTGYMDNFGIKDAIYRAKKRKRHKACNEEKIERKNAAISMKPGEPSLCTQPQTQGRVLMDPLVQVPSPQERQISNLFPTTQGNNSTGAIDVKKRLKRKSETDAESHVHAQKLQTQPVSEKHKSNRLPDESTLILQQPKLSQMPVTPASDRPG